MSIEDIKGYKPHTDEKISKVNSIKDAENALGLILSTVEEDILAVMVRQAAYVDPDDVRLAQIRKAKEKLKEASMWACRAVFQPEEKY